MRFELTNGTVDRLVDAAGRHLLARIAKSIETLRKTTGWDPEFQEAFGDGAAKASAIKFLALEAVIAGKKGPDAAAKLCRLAVIGLDADDLVLEAIGAGTRSTFSIVADHIADVDQLAQPVVNLNWED